MGDALDNTGRLGPVSVLLLIVAASGVMGALRHAINQAWDIHTRPPIIRRKALDLALVLGAAVVLVFSVSLSATREAADWLGDAGWALDLSATCCRSCSRSASCSSCTACSRARGRRRARSGRARSSPRC